MAMSFSRPDPASPAAVADAAFGTSRRGFDQNEVREFLRMVAAELGRLQERERFLERELRTATAEPNLADMELDDAALTRLLGEETARVLSTARESAAEIRSKAEEAASRLLGEAADEAGRIREEADLDASRRRADAAADAESELEMAKQQGREMVSEARAYRERVLGELARRRELAREQIEQLVNGRDRLLQVFERARLVAADVVSELEPLGEPNEYVNLAPTTGPVPVMVANQATSPTATVAGAPATGDVDGDTGARTGADDSMSVTGAASHGEAELDVEAATDERAGENAADAVDALEIVVEEAPESEMVGEEGASVEDSDVQDEGPASFAGDQVDVVEEAVDEEHEVPTDVAVEVVEEAVDEEHEEPTEGAAELDDGPEVDDETGDDTTDTTDAVVDSPAEDDQARSEHDVVVDLFARLRAGTEDDGASDEAEVDDRSDDAVPATSASTMVGELAPEPAAPADLADDDSPFRHRDAELTPIIVSCARKLKRALADEQNEVLESLRRGDPITRIAELLPAGEAHLARYVDAAGDDLVDAANAGAAAITDRKVKRLRKAPANEAVSAAGEVIDEWLVSPLRDRLARCVADGDGDNSAITRRVRSVYREWKTQHIDEHLDDIVRMAYGRGVFEAVEAGTPLVWSLDAAHPACPDCEDNGLAGPVPAGDEYPTGHRYAPAHSGCRCLLLPPDQ